MKKLAESIGDSVVISKLNVDENRETAMKHQVMSIPLLLFFNGGQKIDEILGAVPEHMIRAKVEALL